MNPENGNEEDLQKMLALKRHEQPPPRFFEGMSDKIIDRLHEPEPVVPPSFRQRLGLDFDSRPVWVCLCGVAVCALLVYGLISARHVESVPPPDLNAIDDAALLVGSASGSNVSPTRPGGRVTRPGELPRSIDPAPATDSPAASPFMARPVPAGYQPERERK